MDKQKKIKPLTGEELINKVKELENLSKEEKAKICGYYSVTKNGLERVYMMQFLNALLDAEGIELDVTDKVNGQRESNASDPITVQPNGNANSNKVIAIKPANKPTASPHPLFQSVQQPEIEPVQKPEIEQPEQPEPVVYLDSLVEPIRDESVYGSGWTITELMNEFSGR